MHGELDRTFPHLYAATIKSELEDPSKAIYFPARPRLEVEVRPQAGAAWIGVFAGDEGSETATGLYTTPDDRSLCVVAAGEGYFVEADDPRSWTSIACTPVRHVLPLGNLALIVFADFTSLVAYRFDPGSVAIRLDVAWRSARLGWDELEIARITPDRIEGTAWHASTDASVGFSVNARTGEHEGGAYDL